MLFPAFAAVFFGATQFQRRANVWGTLIAVYALAFGVKGLQLAFQDGVSWITPLFNGTALLIAVVLASRQGVVDVKRNRTDEEVSDPQVGTEPWSASHDDRTSIDQQQPTP